MIYKHKHKDLYKHNSNLVKLVSFLVQNQTIIRKSLASDEGSM